MRRSGRVGGAPDVVELTRALVSVDTVDRDESTALDVLAPLLADAGFVLEPFEHAPGRGGLIAEWHPGGDVPPLCLSGHLDTVPLGAAPWRHEPLGGETAGDRLYGRGTSDMKGGVAAMVVAATRVAALPGPRRAGLRLVLTAAEETGCRGATGLAARLRGRPSGPLLIAEPTGNRVLHGHKGALWLAAETTGVTAHGSTPQLGENAIYPLARAVTRLAEFGFGVPPHPTLGPPTLSVGTIEGGLNTNSVPDRARATIDLRTVIGQDHGTLGERLAGWVGEGVALTTLLDLPPVWTDPADPWARSVVEAVAGVTGVPADREPGAAAYFTDACVLTGALGGVPTLICGPGEPELAHATDEWCSMTRLAESVALFEHVAADWCLGVGRSGGDVG